jgi:ABC-type phosphate transport system ATPase subunit
MCYLPRAVGVPSYRTRVMYVPQRPSLLPGSPADFVKAIMNLHSHKILMRNDIQDTTEQVMKRCYDTAQCWGIVPDLWNRDWMNLSGGEGQRILLSTAASLNTAEILLLDGVFHLFYFPLLCQSSQMKVDRTDICARLRNVADGGKIPGGPGPHT